MKTVAWLNFLAGIWLILSPFILGFSTEGSALWNNIIIGILVVIFGLVFTGGGKKKEKPVSQQTPPAQQ